MAKKQFSDGHYIGDMLNKLRHGKGTFFWETGGVYKGDWVDDKRHGFGIYDHENGVKYEGRWRNNLYHVEGILHEANGCKYSGEFKDGKRDGLGQYKYQRGSEYDGYWRGGQRHGKGINTWPDGSRYDGDWKDDQRHGKGIQTFSNGDRYEGDWKDGQIHGKGIRTYSNGDRYEGDWKDNQRHGKGIYTWLDGSRYDGYWRGGQRHGKGIQTFSNGEKYEGDWKDGQRHGKGINTWPDGSRYDGDWKDDQRHGKGIQTFSNGDRYEGDWKDGQIHGKGIRTYSNGDRYEGDWKDNQRHGKGIYTWLDGSRYDGYWRGGQRHGKGIQTFSNGEKYEGDWKDDQRHGKGINTRPDGSISEGLWVMGVFDKNCEIEVATYDHISINSPIKDIQEVAEAEGRTVQEIYEDLMDDGVINKSNVEKSPVLTQQLNDEFEELIELTVSNAQAYEDWMDLAANGQRMQEGAIAEVWRIKSEQGNLFIKTAHDEKGKKVLLKEIATLEDLMEENLDSIHPHVVFQSKDKDKPLLVMTQVGERSLETDYDNLDIEQGMNFLYDLALDIQRLHEQGHYIHRDLKPGNIAINDTKSGNSIYAGLIDFGSARSNMRKQGEGDRFVSEPWTHPSQREIGVRVRPGQDWYSFTWIAMCVIMGAKYDKIQSMIEGGSFETKFKNKIANIDSEGRENFLSTVEELVELVTEFGEIPDLGKLEIFDLKKH